MFELGGFLDTLDMFRCDRLKASVTRGSRTLDIGRGVGHGGIEESWIGASFRTWLMAGPGACREQKKEFTRTRLSATARCTVAVLWLLAGLHLFPANSAQPLRKRAEDGQSRKMGSMCVEEHREKTISRPLLCHERAGVAGGKKFPQRFLLLLQTPANQNPCAGLGLTSEGIRGAIFEVGWRRASSGCHCVFGPAGFSATWLWAGRDAGSGDGSPLVSSCCVSFSALETF